MDGKHDFSEAAIDRSRHDVPFAEKRRFYRVDDDGDHDIVEEVQGQCLRDTRRKCCLEPCQLLLEKPEVDCGAPEPQYSRWRLLFGHWCTPRHRCARAGNRNEEAGTI